MQQKLENNVSENVLKIIAYMESTTDEQWITEIVRSPCQTKHCAMSHIFNMGGDDEKLCNRWWNWFEDNIATTYMIYPVNDGEHPDYQQPTPKARVLAYLRDVLDGKQKTVWEL